MNKRKNKFVSSFTNTSCSSVAARAAPHSAVFFSCFAIKVGTANERKRSLSHLMTNEGNHKVSQHWDCSEGARWPTHMPKFWGLFFWFFGVFSCVFWGKSKVRNTKKAFRNGI